MTDSVLLPEMVTAGVEAFMECERQELDETQKVIAVWLAMEAIRVIAEGRKPREMVH